MFGPRIGAGTRQRYPGPHDPLRTLDHFGTPLLVLGFLGLVWLQARHPLRRQHFRAFGRLLRNLVLSLPSVVVMRLAMLPIPLAVALWAERAHFGLLHWLAPPGCLCHWNAR